MEIKQHIERLQKAIREQHGCDSTHVESVRLQKTYRGQTAWSGTIEVFDLINHAKASRCYAWPRVSLAVLRAGRSAVTRGPGRGVRCVGSPRGVNPFARRRCRSVQDQELPSHLTGRLHDSAAGRRD